MILISGSLAYDYIMDFPGYFRDHILPEKLHVLSVSFLINKMERNFGGTAGNIAYNLALLDEQPAILASAGNDFGEYERWLRAKGVELRAVNRVDGVPTAAAYIMTDKADNQITAFYPGAMQFSSQSTVHSSQLLKSVKLAIIAPGNVEDMKRLPALYRKHDVPYVYDPGQAIPALSGKDLKKGIAGAKVFISNDYELAMVLKKTGWGKAEVLKRVEVLVTTLGEKGSVIEWKMENGKWKMYRIPPAKPKNTSDPTGAGDAYRAGFIKGLLMGLPYDKVGKLASTVAVYTVEKYGTQTHWFSWKGLMQRYKENYKERLV
ncbi:carbohydrate kinase family protein [Candidatus Uhrbacteria bacterium]|nr:carbohydrate kinase family protein [Candidatus Uhrbacteria bacterium]